VRHPGAAFKSPCHQRTVGQRLRAWLEGHKQNRVLASLHHKSLVICVTFRVCLGWDNDWKDSMSESLQLAELLCSRLCHDLSGLVGSLIGVLEMAREEQADSETLVVAEETAVELTQRLKLLRAAWGQDSEPLDLFQLQAFAEGLLSSRRLRLDLGGLEPEAEFSPAAGRLILNVLLLAAESLPGGGIVALSGSPASSVLVTIAGPRAAWPRGFGACLIDESAAWAAATGVRSLQAPLTALIARQHGVRMSMLMPAGAGTEAALPPLLLSFDER
jgi:histidine phosphotransferase ChpT